MFLSNRLNPVLIILCLVNLSIAAFAQSTPSEDTIKKQHALLIDGEWVKKTIDNYPSSEQLAAFYKHVAINANYPPIARSTNSGGMVYILFEVDEMGVIQNLETTYEFKGSCGDQIKELLSQNLSFWDAAEYEGKIFISKYLLPIRFELEGMKKEVFIPELSLDSSFYELEEINIVGYSSFSGGQFIPAKPIKRTELDVYTLDLSNHGLSEFPDRLYDLKNLKTLSLNNNHLNALPDDFYKFRRMSKLLINHNQLKYLPKNFEKLRYIYFLDLSYNQIEVFPPQLLEMKQLYVLNLSNNPIQHLPVDINKMKDLKALGLLETNISTFPEEFYKLKQLEKLYITEENLADGELERLKKKLPKLEILNE